MFLGHMIGVKQTILASDCFKKCIQMENSKFARLCRKDGGYFKCCGSYWWLDTFEEARNMLIKDGLGNSSL